MIINLSFLTQPRISLIQTSQLILASIFSPGLCQHYKHFNNSHFTLTPYSHCPISLIYSKISQKKNCLYSLSSFPSLILSWTHSNCAFIPTTPQNCSYWNNQQSPQYPIINYQSASYLTYWQNLTPDLLLPDTFPSFYFPETSLTLGFPPSSLVLLQNLLCRYSSSSWPLNKASLPKGLVFEFLCFLLPRQLKTLNDKLHT